MLNPGWIFVPSDLDYFINYELENHKTRQNLQDRAVPDCHEYLSHQIATRVQPSNATMPLYRNTNDGGGGGDGGDGGGETKGKRKADEPPEAGPSQSKRRSRPAVKKTQAAERPRREGAGKRKNLEWLHGCAKPLYETDEDIMKWMQAVEPYLGPPTPESINRSV